MWKGRWVQGFLGNAEESREVTMCTGRMAMWVKWGPRGPGPPALDRGSVQEVRSS